MSLSACLRSAGATTARSRRNGRSPTRSASCSRSAPFPRSLRPDQARMPSATNRLDRTRAYFEDDAGGGAAVVLHGGLLDSVEDVRESKLAQALAPAEFRPTTSTPGPRPEPKAP